MNCIPPHRAPTEHEIPDARERRLACEAYGEKHAARFVAEHADLVLQLISHYQDGDAERLLGDLRDLFWADDRDDDEATP
jgi:hypothetical protein